MKTSKPFLLIIACMCAIYSNAEQMPSGYYDAIQGKKDEALKVALFQVIKGGERLDYGPNTYHSSSNPPQWQVGDIKAYGTWHGFQLADQLSNGCVWDMYSATKRSM